jgi:protease-4
MIKREQRRYRPFRVLGIIIIIVAIILLIILLSASITTKSLGANVALIKIDGEILSSEGLSIYEATYSDEVIKNIENAVKTPSIKAIIFEINSPGGSAVASSEIADAIKNARAANKTTVALIREQGTSGAYWVASACDHIVAHPLAITGSIGVISSYLDFSGFLDRYNVSYERLVSGKYKDAMSPFRELTDEERAIIQKKLDIVYGVFIQEVAKNRNLSEDSVKEMATGMFYLGKEAKDLGLVDELGSKQEAVDYIEQKYGITASIREYKKSKSLFDQLAEYMPISNFWLGRGIGASLADKNLMGSLNSVAPQA